MRMNRGCRFQMDCLADLTYCRRKSSVQNLIFNIIQYFLLLFTDFCRIAIFLPPKFPLHSVFAIIPYFFLDSKQIFGKYVRKLQKIYIPVYWTTEKKSVSFSCQTGSKMLQWVRISEKVIKGGIFLPDHNKSPRSPGFFQK